MYLSCVTLVNNYLVNDISCWLLYYWYNDCLFIIIWNEKECKHNIVFIRLNNYTYAITKMSSTIVVNNVGVSFERSSAIYYNT